jgi:hypothetical protein
MRFRAVCVFTVKKKRETQFTSRVVEAFACPFVEESALSSLLSPSLSLLMSLLFSLGLNMGA